MIVPTVALPPATPFTSHTIASPPGTQSDATNSCVCPVASATEAGAIELVLAHTIITLALPDFAASATLVAVTATVAGEGTDSGAV